MPPAAWRSRDLATHHRVESRTRALLSLAEHLVEMPSLCVFSSLARTYTARRVAIRERSQAWSGATKTQHLAKISAFMEDGNNLRWRGRRNTEFMGFEATGARSKFVRR